MCMQSKYAQTITIGYYIHSNKNHNNVSLIVIRRKTNKNTTKPY